MNTAVKWKRFSLLGIGVLCLAALPALGEVPNGQGNQNYPEPGTLNYVEGSAYLQGQQLNNKNLGDSEIAPGQVLRTKTGKAEVLLTPGVFLRLDDRSAVKMISPDITNTEIEVLKGEVGIEVDEIHPQNDLQIQVKGVATRLEQRGFYEFIASPPKVLVFTGEAQVEINEREQNVKKHHEMALVARTRERPHGFKMKNAEDSLYNWSKLRSQYLAEANQQYENEYGYGGAPDWYWNPGFGWDWAWAPGWGWGWGPGWGWGTGWGWGGPGLWGGPAFYYHRAPGRVGFNHGGNLHGDFHSGGFRGGALRGGGALHAGGMGFHGSGGHGR
jgi:FecR protein